MNNHTGARLSSPAHQELRALFDSVLTLDEQNAGIPEGVANEFLAVAMSTCARHLRHRGFAADAIAGELQKRVEVTLKSTLEALRMWDEGLPSAPPRVLR